MAGRKGPKESLEESGMNEVKRPFPSFTRLTKAQKEEAYKLAQDFIGFESKARIPNQVIYEVEQTLGPHQYEELSLGVHQRHPRSDRLMIKDPWGDGGALVVRFGHRPLSDGVNMIVTHSDSPCLRIKPKPLRQEWEYLKELDYLGAELSAVAHGGINVHQWVGQKVEIVGYVENHNGARNNIRLDGFVPDNAAHLERDQTKEIGEAFAPEESLRVVTGHDTPKALMVAMGLKRLSDFAKAKLYCVPKGSSSFMGADPAKLIVGYGHDNRSCTYAAVTALMNARRLERTGMVFITGCEETGDVGQSGATGPFFDLALDRIIDQAGTRMSERGIRRLLARSSMVIGDVDIAPSGHDREEMDYASAAKIGLGATVCADSATSSHPGFIAKLMELATNGARGRPEIVFQPVGSFYNQNHYSLLTKDPDGKTGLERRVGERAWVGLPCAVTHGTRELIHSGDLYAAREMYKRFFESPNMGLAA